jgi:hypothetical protein
MMTVPERILPEICFHADDVGQLQRAGDDRGVGRASAVLGDNPRDARCLEMEGVERAQLDPDGDRARERTLGAQLGQPEQGTDQPFANGLEVAAALAEIRIGEPEENRSDLVQRARDRPLRRQALLENQPPGLSGDLGAAQHQAMGLDQISAGAFPSGEPSLQSIELLIGADDAFFEVRQLGGTISAQDAAFGDRDLCGEQVRRSHRDPAGRTLATKVGHLSRHGRSDRSVSGGTIAVAVPGQTAWQATETGARK